MKLEKLTCNSCGAPLHVPETANFCTCNHCSTELAVRRTDDVTFTEQLDELADRTEELSERIDQLSTQNEIAALDREWELEREKFIVSGKHGHRRIPTQAGSIAAGIGVTGFGIIWTVMAAGMGGGAFALFGVLFIGFGIVTSIVSFTKAGNYRQAERRYRRRRQELMRKVRS